MHNLHTENFYDQIQLGKKKIQGRFVIPSGIRCAHASSIEKYFSMESIGIITTKSISVAPKEGYKEPLYIKYGENSYMNAVGLANPGAQAFREELSGISVPQNKFLLVSIFGGDWEEFSRVANLLRDVADGFELNMSCPHAKGYGLQIGNDPAQVALITKMVVQSVDLPVFVKLSASVPNLAQTAGIAVENGAAGITITNTVGPGIESIDGKPVLSNGAGGLSGEAIRPLGIKVLRDIRSVVGREIPIIGMGGIFNADHVKSYHAAGADFFGIGSALTNLSTEEAAQYLQSVQNDLIHNCKSNWVTPPPVRNMDYQPCVVEQNTALTDTLHKIKISPWANYEQNRNVAGKFFFLMIPGTGEKPFALYSHNDREFIVKNVGVFTRALTRLAPGDTLYLRGPYGHALPAFSGADINFVAGGTGLSPVYEMARKYRESNPIRFFLGGKTADDLFDLDRFKALGEVHAATEDGSTGDKGFVSDVLNRYNFNGKQIFINVGPRPMIEACGHIEQTLTDEIWVAIEYHTSCGVGICGKCATESGLLSCVDGPFLRWTDALRIKECEHQ